LTFNGECDADAGSVDNGLTKKQDGADADPEDFRSRRFGVLVDRFAIPWKVNRETEG
jgi:hypothetical protein